MNRQNLFSDVWDGESEEDSTRHRIFWRPDDARLGSTLYELRPHAPEQRIRHFAKLRLLATILGCRFDDLRQREQERQRRQQKHKPRHRVHEVNHGVEIAQTLRDL